MKSLRQNKQPRVAVVGGGLAGVAAAVSLADKAEVTVFEAGRALGGRARSLDKLTDKNQEWSFLDNGQHILLGAYQSLRTLLSVLEVDIQSAFHQLPMQWYLSDGLRFQAANLPAPFHLLVGVLRAKNISLKDKWFLLADMNALKRYQPSTQETVDEWLRRRHTSRLLVRDFWQPLVWGALNTPLEEASLALLRNVLQDGVWAKKEYSNYWLPKVDLSALWVEPAEKWLIDHDVRIEKQKRIGRLEYLPGERVAVDGEIFDAVILAVAPQHALSILPTDLPIELVKGYQNLKYHSITTIYLKYSQPVYLPAPMTGLAEGTAQWLISRAVLNGRDHEVVAVISCSDVVAEKYHIQHADDWVSRVHQDVRKICPYIGEPIAQQVITEKRATTSVNGLYEHPQWAWLRHHGIFVAGDYLHPRYPATLEAAVQSGQMAANFCLNEWYSKGK